MSKKIFTESDLKILRENKYTYKVTPNTISFTKEFKTIFYEEYLGGNIPRLILEKYGYPAEMLGKQRIWGIAHCIKNEYEKHGEFHEGSLPRPAFSGSAEHMTPEESLRHLQHEVNYLKQEMEFLKKFPRSEVPGSRCCAYE